MTETELNSTIEKLLRDIGVKRGSRSWREYQRGKIAMAEIDLSTGDYFKALNFIADWVGV